MLCIISITWVAMVLLMILSDNNNNNNNNNNNLYFTRVTQSNTIFDFRCGNGLVGQNAITCSNH